MTSKLIVNSLAADTGVSTITFADQAKMGNSIFHSTGFTIGDSFLHSTGVNLTNINATGVITATKFVGEVSVGSSITFEDNEKAYFGTGTDFSIYHNGSASYLDESGTGGLIAKTNTAFQVFNSAGSQPAFTVTPGGSVELYHGSTKRIESASYGALITGQCYVSHSGTTPGFSLSDNGRSAWGANDDLQIYHSSSDNNSYIKETGGGSLVINADDFYLQNVATTTFLRTNSSGSIDLNYSGSKKLETAGHGINITGGFVATGDCSIADKLTHAGDENTAIRFPAADTVTVETAGTERLRIDSGGRLLLGHTSSQEVYGTAKLQIQGTTGATSSMSLLRHGNSPYLTLGSSGGSSLGAVTALADDARIGQITFAGADGTDINTHSASIAAYVDGSVSSNTVPGRLVFATSTGASETPRMYILSGGEVGINVSDPNSYGANGHGYRGLTVQAPAGGYSGITIRSNYAGGGILAFADGSGSNAELKNIALQADHVNRRLDIMVNGSPQARFTENGFHPNPSDTAAANALDDYEEGTAFSSTGHLTVHQANYTKVGRMCVINWRVSVTSGNTQTISLPFTMVGNHGDHVIGFNQRGSTWEAVYLASSSTVTFSAGFSKGTITYQTQ